MRFVITKRHNFLCTCSTSQLEQHHQSNLIHCDSILNFQCIRQLEYVFISANESYLRWAHLVVDLSTPEVSVKEEIRWETIKGQRAAVKQSRNVWVMLEWHQYRPQRSTKRMRNRLPHRRAIPQKSRLLVVGKLKSGSVKNRESRYVKSLPGAAVCQLQRASMQVIFANPPHC